MEYLIWFALTTGLTSAIALFRPALSYSTSYYTFKFKIIYYILSILVAILLSPIFFIILLSNNLTNIFIKSSAEKL